MDPRDPHGHFAHEFSMLDVNEDKVLSPDELFEGLCKRGWDQDELQGLFAKLDTNGDGQISKDEFLDGMAKNRKILKMDVVAFEHGLRRMGINWRENIKALKEQWESVNQSLAPMKVVRYSDLVKHGKLPRSSDGITIPLTEVGVDERVVFCSHNWKRGDEEQCKSNGHVWEGAAHPDDEKATKHKLLCAGVAELAEEKGWSLDKVHVWLDFCGIDQDDNAKKWAGVESLRGYLSVCDAVVIPYPQPPPADASKSVDVLAVYGERGWTRLEALVAYVVGILQGSETPELWVVWDGPPGPRLERFDFSLDPDHLPASEKSILKSEADRPAIKVHQDKLLEEIKASLERNGYITKHDSKVNCVAFDPKDASGDLVASGGDDGVIKLVNRKTGTAVWSVEIGTGVRSLAFNKDGSMLAAGGDGVVRVWAVASGSRPVERCTLKGHSSFVLSVAWSPDGKTLASGSPDMTVRLWDVVSGEVKCTLKGHSDWVRSVSFSPDGKTLASGSNDSTVRLWDVESGKEKETKALATKVKEGGSAGGNRSGQYIVIAEGGDMVYVYLATSEGEKHGESLAAFRSPDYVGDVCCRGTCVAVGCIDGQVLFLEAPLLARAAD